MIDTKKYLGSAAKGQVVLRCGICDSHRLTPILDLGEQPLAERMEEDAPKYRLRLVQCEYCHLVQLDFIAPPEEVFPPDHPYTSGNSLALHEHFEKLAQELSAKLDWKDIVVDIGCNDGTLLSKFSTNLRRIGVDPTNQAQKVKKLGIGNHYLEFKEGDEWVGSPVYQEFFTSATAHRIIKEYGQADVIIATNVLAHVPDPHGFLEAVHFLLADNGVFVTENHDVKQVLNGQWDTVYHEHLRYYSPSTLERLLKMHQLHIDRIEYIDTHGGSFRSYVYKEETVQMKADKAAEQMHELLARIYSRDQIIYGVGATTRASAVINFMGLEMTCVCEVSTSDKIGKVMPGTKIPIVDEEVLFGKDQPDYALLFSWHLADTIIPKLKSKGFKGKFIIPLPEPRVI